MIKELQIELNEMGAVIKALPHLARPSDRIAKEVLAFVCIMLFNANNDVQVSSLRQLLHLTMDTKSVISISSVFTTALLPPHKGRELLCSHPEQDAPISFGHQREVSDTFLNGHPFVAA